MTTQIVFASFEAAIRSEVRVGPLISCIKEFKRLNTENLYVYSIEKNKLKDMIKKINSIKLFYLLN